MRLRRSRISIITMIVLAFTLVPSHTPALHAESFALRRSHPASGAQRTAQVRYIYRGLMVQPPHRKLGRGVNHMPLFNQYFLETRHGEKASVGFHDGTVIHMNQDTDAVLASPTVTQVKRGEVAEYLAPGTNHKVQTAAAVAAAIGTVYDVRTDGRRSVFVVLHGALRVSNGSGQVVVKSDHQTIVTPNAPPAPPTPADARAVFAWTDGIPTPDLGEDVALDANGGGVLSVSSQTPGIGSARHIDDGLLTSGWQTAAGKIRNQAVKLRFFGGTPYRISDIIIDPAATGGDPSSADLRDFEVRVSSTNADAGSFTTVFHGTCKQANTLQRFTLPVPVRAKYVELVELNNYGNQTHADVAEMEAVATSSLFALPQGLAVDTHGDLYVADSNANRIEKLSPKGSLRAAWGAKGAGPGQFNRPEAVTVARNGTIYAADTLNDRIQKLSPSGRYLGSIGTSGVKSGQFESPQALALDAHGDLYVADLLRIQKFSPAGKVLATWTGPSATDSFNVPDGIAVDAHNNVWISDTGNNRVLELSASGTLRRTVILGGSKYGAFHNPSALALSPSGDVYVVDGFNDRVVVLSPTGHPLHTWGKQGNSRGQFLIPIGIAISPSGRVFVSDTFNGRIETFSLDGHFRSTFGKYATVPQILGEPSGLAADQRGHIYVADDLNDRIQTRSLTGAVSAVQGYHGFVLLEKGTKGLGQFDYPHGVAVDTQGTIYVADSDNFRVQILSDRGPIAAFGKKGAGPGQFLLPWAIAVDAHRNLYVTDWGNDRVQKFSPDGKKVLWVSGSRGKATGQFQFPEGIAVDNAGHVYVADTYNDRIQVLDAQTGKVLDVWGTAGFDINDRFFGPTAVAVDAAGNVLVADSGHESIQKLSPTGALLDEFELPGPGAIPNALTVDPSGAIYVGVSLGSRIFKLAPTGELLDQWQ